MGQVNTNAGNVRLVGERLCLDFCNTVDSHHRAQPKEYLPSYRELLRWGRHSGMLTAEAAGRLGQAVTARPGEAEAVLRQALRLRGALFRLFAAAPPQVADLAELNAVLAAAPERSQVIRQGDGFAWAWLAEEETLEQILWPLAWSAAELLTSPELDRVRECANPDCSWLFLDLSWNRSRRWCSMQDCGNRAKARRHYRRQKGEDGGMEG